MLFYCDTQSNRRNIWDLIKSLAVCRITILVKMGMPLWRTIPATHVFIGAMSRNTCITRPNIGPLLARGWTELWRKAGKGCVATAPSFGTYRRALSLALFPSITDLFLCVPEKRRVGSGVYIIAGKANDVWWALSSSSTMSRHTWPLCPALWTSVMLKEGVYAQPQL